MAIPVVVLWERSFAMPVYERALVELLEQGRAAGNVGPVTTYVFNSSADFRTGEARIVDQGLGDRTISFRDVVQWARQTWAALLVISDAGTWDVSLTSIFQ